jgi:hypothetical protein
MSATQLIAPADCANDTRECPHVLAPARSPTVTSTQRPDREALNSGIDRIGRQLFGQITRMCAPTSSASTRHTPSR